MKRLRIIGTTSSAIDQVETELGFRLPPSFREWLLKNNGRSVAGVRVFPAFDERDPRMTWDSIVRQYDGGQWGGEMFADEEVDFRHLLPFASFGNGDYYCFDYSNGPNSGEVPVVLWSHETGETQARGQTFTDFLHLLEQGRWAAD